jgi:hypothetical protein
MLLTRIKVRIVVHGAPAEAKEVIITALKRTEFRQSAEMPLANQTGAIARLLQQRRQGRMIRRQADIRATCPWLLEPKPQPILVATGDQRETCRGADGRIGVTLKEAHSSGGDLINIGRGEVATSITGHVGIAEVVSQNEDDVRWLRRRLGIGADGTGRQRSRPGRGIA